jgi:acyl-CoA thioesterase YciA
MEKVVFHEPVHVGDLASYYGELVRIGRTSVTVKVVVEVTEPGAQSPARRVTEAEITYVNVDDAGRPVPIPRVEG